MTQNLDNRKRAFAEVVTIDAWHKPFDGKNKKVSLHADVVFGTARVGGESQSPIRFRLRLQRAQIVVIVPPTEPVKVDKASVSRDAPEVKGKITRTIEKSRTTKVRGKLAAMVSGTKQKGSVAVDAEAQSAAASKSKLQFSGPFRMFVVTQSQTSDGDYRWNVHADELTALDGRPWDAKKHPRLKLVDQRQDGRGIPPAVRVEVRCRREDLIIDDFETKDEKLWEKIASSVGFRNKMAAAESYIRDRLSDEGLEVHNIEDKFGVLTIARAMAEPN